jgi:hypothetical protein
MLYTDGRGWLPPPPSYATLITFWIEFSTVVVDVVVLLSAGITSLQQVLNRTRRNSHEVRARLGAPKGVSEMLQ